LETKSISWLHNRSFTRGKKKTGAGKWERVHRKGHSRLKGGSKEPAGKGVEISMCFKDWQRETGKKNYHRVAGETSSVCWGEGKNYEIQLSGSTER